MDITYVHFLFLFTGFFLFKSNFFHIFLLYYLAAHAIQGYRQRIYSHG
jgi:hypothetical protein